MTSAHAVAVWIAVVAFVIAVLVPTYVEPRRLQRALALMWRALPEAVRIAFVLVVLVACAALCGFA